MQIVEMNFQTHSRLEMILLSKILSMI
ncbi:MAG: hypothetical protein ACLTL2_16525 [Blautia sp.]